MTTLAVQLAGNGYRPLLVSTHGPLDSPLIEEARSSGVPVENLQMSRMYDPGGPARFLSLVRRTNPGVVHTRTTRADILGRLAARRGAAVVTNIVNMYPDDCLAQHGPIAGRLVMEAARRTKGGTTVFAVNAQALAGNVQDAFDVPASAVQVVYDGIDLERWRGAEPVSIPGVGDDDKVCLTVARLHPQKGLTDLIEAAQILRDPSIRFVVAGDGPQRNELTEAIDRAGLGERFVLLGARSDIPGLLARADLFVLPSRFEGLPSAAIEAMAAGKPIVATSVAGMPELVENGVNGWLVPTASPEELAEALKRALSSDLQAAGHEGLRRAQLKFSAPAMAKAFLSLYQGAAGAQKFL